jgi:hypothetical protein
MADPAASTFDFNCRDQGAPSWHDRAALAAAMLAAVPALRAPAATLADIGCGDDKLREALRRAGATIAWHGYDLRPQRPDVTVYDVRLGPLPRRHTAAALLGVTEYLPDLPAVLRRLAGEVSFLVLSHVLRDPVLYPPARRAELGWVTQLDEAGLAGLLADAGLRILEQRRTADGRTIVCLCASTTAASAPAPYGVLTPYPIPRELAGRKVPNHGDGLILRAIERLVGSFDQARTFSPRIPLPADAEAALAATPAVVLAGANQLSTTWTIWPGLTADRLRASGLRLVPFGIGLHGAPGHSERLSEATKAVLLALHERIACSSWRCPRTVELLHRELPQIRSQVLMTGCPVAYDRPLLDGEPFRAEVGHVAVTATERGDFLGRETAVLDYAAATWPRARRTLVLHQNWSPPTRWELLRHRLWPRPRARLDACQQLRQHAVRRGFRVFAPAGADALAAFYRTVDVHVGSRLHAHLHCLSQCKRSWLVPVDGRAAGIAEWLDFPLCQPDTLHAHADFDFERVRARARATFPVLRQFVDSLPR